MAYMNQERKAQVAPLVKAVLTRYGVKGSLSIRNHMTLCLKIKAGTIDFIGNRISTDQAQGHAHQMTAETIQRLRKEQSLDVNPYWFHEHFSDRARAFLSDVMTALKGAGWYDKSDAHTDHFDTAYYIGISIGDWKNPYQLIA